VTSDTSNTSISDQGIKPAAVEPNATCTGRTDARERGNQRADIENLAHRTEDIR
jgi:hypothetical protein